VPSTVRVRGWSARWSRASAPRVRFGVAAPGRHPAVSPVTAPLALTVAEALTGAITIRFSGSAGAAAARWTSGAGREMAGRPGRVGWPDRHGRGATPRSRPGARLRTGHRAVRLVEARNADRAMGPVCVPVDSLLDVELGPGGGLPVERRPAVATWVATGCAMASGPSSPGGRHPRGSDSPGSGTARRRPRARGWVTGDVGGRCPAWGGVNHRLIIDRTLSPGLGA